jgi:predicted acetyltransferase
MTTSEIPVPTEEEAILAPMMRDYVIEMSEIIGVPAGDGRYPLLDLYWAEPNLRWPFWLKAGEANAGFALVRREVEASRTEMAEFFIAPEFRGKGIGLAAARRLISRYPGAWRITQREANARAIAFWHRVLDGFVVYDETTTATEAVRREQRFTIF